MASTYSPNLRLTLMATGEQQGTWGGITNTNLGTLLEEAIGGYTSVTVTDGADTTLSTNNGSADQSRNMTINLTGALTAARNVICPAIEKVYIVKNATTGGYAVTFKVSGQTGVSIPNGSTYILYVNGTDVVLATGTIAAQNSNNVSITGGSITGITDLAVADGGTGASTAAGAATNLGLGTGDSPQFTAVNIGNATDTTITRSSAGVIAVEGGIVPLENRTNTFSANQIIEVTDNTNAALRITQIGTGNAILVEDSANPDSTPFVINTTGKVLIGDTQARIGVYSTSPNLNVSGTSLNSTSAGFFDWSSNSFTGPALFTQKSKSGVIGTHGIVASGDRLYIASFSGSDGTAFLPAATMEVWVDGTPGTNDMPGRLVFSTTADGASSPTERMRIRSDGNIGIGGAGNAVRNVLISKAITGGTTAGSLQISTNIASDVTSSANGVGTFLGTDASAFTLTALSHFSAAQGTVGAGSTVSAQYGFISSSLNIDATTNIGFYAQDTAAVTAGKTAYGFRSDINTATGGGTTWGFYALGTAANYFAGQVQLGSGSAGTPSLSAFGDTNTGMWYPAADTIAWATGGSERMRIRSDGNIGIGGAGNAARTVLISKAITGGTIAYSLSISTNIASDVTSSGIGASTFLGTDAAAFTMDALIHFSANQGTFGAGSTVSAQYGFVNGGLNIGATANIGFLAQDTAAVTTGKTAYGFYSSVNTATGGGTTYGFYAGGTARNLFSGDVQVFGAGGLGYTTGSGGAVTQGTSRTTGVTLNKTNGAITLFSAAGTTTWQSFTVTNSTVAATDTIIVCQKSGTDLYELHVTAVSAGSFRISFRTTGGTTTEQPVFNFAVIKAVTA